MSLLAAALLLSTATAETPPPPVDPATITGPIRMKPSEIRAYNANLTPDHPNFIRCTVEVATGTLAKKVRTCRTNQDWARLGADGNDKARSLVDSARNGWTQGRD
jgi:hypothetical protein